MKYKLAILDSHPIQYRSPLFRKLARHPEVDLCVYYRFRQGASETMDSGFRVKFKWDVPLLEGYSYEFLSAGHKIIRQLKKEKYDALLVYGYSSFTNWIISILSPILKIPVIFMGETVFFRRPGFLKKIFLNSFFHNIRAFLYIGTKSLEFYRHFKIPCEQLFFAPYCVDNDFFISRIDKHKEDKERIKKEKGIADNAPVILYASKMTPRKRPQDLMSAFKKMRENACLVFVGDGKMRQCLEDFALGHKIKDVFFLGFKNQSELPRYYAMADIFVLPSGYEPWGLAVNEAMCAGLPILTTNRVAAAYDLLREGVNGYTFAPGDVDRLALLLDELIDNPERLRKMGESSREIIRGWNYDVCVEGIRNALGYVSGRRE